MPMTFYVGNRAFVLFYSWHTSSDGIFAAACIGIFLLCLFHEWFATFRANSKNNTQFNKYKYLAMFCNNKIGQMLLYYISLVLSYFIMLLLMTFNGYIFIVIVLGLTIGYALFGFARGGTSSELCCEQEENKSYNTVINAGEKA